MKTASYPETYLHVQHCGSGQEWIVPIRARQALNLERRVKEWIRSEFGGELRLDGDFMPKLDGDYYAKIMTDARPPESGICWESGGFYLKSDLD